MEKRKETTIIIDKDRFPDKYELIDINRKEEDVYLKIMVSNDQNNKAGHISYKSH